MASSDQKAEGDDRFNALLLEYVEGVERGEAPDRAELLRTHPEYARELAAFFAARDQVDRIAAPLRAGGAMDSSSGGHRGGVRPGSGSRSGPGVLPQALNAEVGRIGDFRLLREVGRGGMGVVYEAEQVSLRRRVALKVLPFAAAVDPRQLHRFRNEAQAAAHLHHSNIVPVFAVGTESGVNYYVMQFIDGQSLAQVLTELKEARSEIGSVPSRPAEAGSLPVGRVPSAETRLLGGPIGSTSRALAISTEHTGSRRDYFRRVVEWVRQAADALEYAHQVGVIHRDVKPANLLLDGSGRLWVTDFGLALIRSGAGLTATGELLGTVRYMSPEQALVKPGLVDHRTDVYSLGATLYELLTLRPVFDGEDRHVLLHQLADEDPTPPRTVDRSIPPELETIVLKALAKLPSDRYSSARELADDLQRFLDDRPVLARRPTLLDRAAKWVRRHRLTALAAVVILILASVGLGISTAIIAREHAETKEAYVRERRANERERQRAQEAEDHYQRTRRAVDLFVELSDEGTLDFPPLAPLRQRLLEAAVAYYAELSDHREDPAIRRDLEQSRARLARLQGELDAISQIHTVLLFDQPAVVAHLELTPEQMGRIAPLLERVKAQQRSRTSPASEGKREELAELAAACRKGVEEVLTAAQYRRLGQVHLQLPGPHLFRPETLAPLGLTVEQKEQVRKIQAGATQASLRLFVTAERREESIADIVEIWKKARGEIVASLTPAQKVVWSEMIGPPILEGIRMPLPPRE